MRLFDRLHNLFFDSVPSSGSPSIKFVKSRKAILTMVSESQRHGAVLGVYCNAFGEGMFLTTVEDVLGDEDEIIVVFNPVDSAGIPLLRNTVSLHEIKMLCTFEKQFAAVSGR